MITKLGFLCFSLIGLVIFVAPHNLHAHGDSPAANYVRFRRLDTTNSLSQNGASVILQDRHGLMWFDTYDGLNRYNGYHFKICRSHPGDKNSLSQKRVFDLPEDNQGNIWIDTAGALDKFVSAPEKKRYRFKLEGFDQSWNEVDYTCCFATYTNLPPGHYTFRVQAVNNSDQGSDHDAALDVTTTSPWWATTWFRGLVVAAIAALIFGLYYYWRGRTVQAQNRRLELLMAEHTHALQQSEERFRSMAQTATDAIITIGADGKILFFNRAAEKVFGYSNREMIGQPVEALIPEQYRAKHKVGFNRHLETGQATLIGKTIELEGLHKDGQIFPIELSLSEAQINDQTTFTGIIRDITERVQTELTLQQRNRELALINRAGQAFSSTLEPDQVFVFILQEIHNLLDVTSTSLWLRLPESGEVVCQHAIGPGADKIIGWRLAPGQGLAGHAAQTGETLLVPDTRIDPRHFKGVDQEVDLETRSLLNLPLKAKGEVIGVLNLVDTTVGRFTSDDLKLLEPVATAAASAIENAHLFEAEHVALEQTKTLYAASLALTATVNLQQVLERILIELQKVVPYDSASVQHLKEGYMEVIAGTGFPNLSDVLGLRLYTKTSRLDQEIIHNKTPLILKNATQHPEFQFRRDVEFGIRAWLGVPLLFGDRVIGKITLDKKEPNFYTHNHAQLAMAFATQAAIAIENAQLYASAQEARAEAESANQAKSTFLAHMSHELRTPLNSILGYTQILKRDPAMRSPQQKNLGIIEQSGHHLLTLIEDVLDLAKVESGKITLEPTEFALLPFLQTIVEIIEVRAELKGLEFRFHLDPSLRKIHGQHIRADEKRLRQVLINLLGNAVKFTETGTVTLQVTATDEHGLMNDEPGDSDLHPSSFILLTFEVIDTGPGIASEDLETIFEPFHQANTSRYQPSGTGLGLAISQELITLMGGEIQVESTTQKPVSSEAEEFQPPNFKSKIQNPKSKIETGSRFWFDLSLPLVSPGQTDSRPKSPGKIIGFDLEDETSPHILIIDDRASNRTMLFDLLAPLGFELLEAADGYTGLDLLLTHRPEVIITDLVMPGLDGFELIRRVRREASLEQPVIIAVSASAYRHDRERSLAAGSNAFLPKPIDIEALLTLLAKHLPLTWIYQSPAEPPSEPAPASSLISPPSATIAELLELANMGDIMALQEQAQQLAHQNPAWQPFTTELLNLAATYQMQKICRWLENQIENEE